MRFRNKKTGEIKDFGNLQVYAETENTGESQLLGNFDSFKQILEYYEDYTLPEPLIKDERIRRAVRAWAEIGKYEHIYYDRAYNRLADDHDFVHCIEFAIDPCPDADSERCYTITELCGEEDVEEDLRDEEY